MPLYSYQCKCCENTTDAITRMAERHTRAPECGKNATHGRMQLRIMPVIVYAQRECHYKCPVTGRNVTSNRQRTNIMREHNLIDANDFPLTPKVIEQAEARVAKGRQAAEDLKKPLFFQ